MAIFSFKGASGEGQANFLSNFVEKYIEETTSYAIEMTQTQLADINSFTVYNYGGQGGQETGAYEMDFGPVAIQQNSLAQYSMVSVDSTDSAVKKVKRNKASEYIVQDGDTLSFIASDFGVSANSIIWANKLKNSDSLRIGQRLTIPPISGVIYTVKKGDTLISIAKKHDGDLNEVISFNGLPKDETLKIGQEIIIPNGKLPKQAPAVASANYVKGAVSSYLPDLKQYFLIPTSGFNWRKLHGRNGVDISNSCGTPIFSAAEGKVVISDGTGYNGGFGKFIKLSHPNGTETIYGHASKLLVGAGEQVNKGQMIALMGTTGRSTGCHLHFEVHGAKNPLAKY